MKKLIYKSRPITLLWCLVAFINLVNAKANFDETRYISKRLKISKTANVELINKYGNIDIDTWDKDSMAVDVTIRVYSNQLFKIDELFNKIKIDFKNSQNYASVETIWDNSSVINNASRDIKKLFGSNERVEINYKIMCPSTVELEVDNKFGNIYLKNFEGEIKAALSHGNLRTGKLNELDLDIKYGKVRIAGVKDLSLSSKFSDIDIEKASKVKMNSVSSEANFEYVESIMLDSKHDDISIEGLTSGTIESAFSDIEIDELNNNLTANLRFGSLQVEKSYTSKVVITGSYTDVDVIYGPKMSLKYNVNLVNGKNFNIDAPYNVKNNTSNSSDFQIYSGSIGKGVLQTSISTFQLKNSSVHLGVVQ